MKTPALVVLMLLATGGCGVAEPDVASFSFALRQVDSIDWENPALTVTGGRKRIDASGELWTGCGGAQLSGSLSRLPASGLVLTIREHRDGDGCYAIVTPYEFTATIGDLEPGRYHLQILLLNARGETPPRTIFHDFVQVR